MSDDTLLKVAEIIAPKLQPKAVKKYVKKQIEEPVHDDPRAELKRLTHKHASWTRKSVAFRQAVTDRDVTLESGEKITVVADVTVAARAATLLAVKTLNSDANGLVTAMRRQLKTLDIYNLFLEKVPALRGEKTSAYIVSMIDIHKAHKPSNLIRYCGNACNDKGEAEHREKNCGPKTTGGKGTFNDTLKSKIWLAFKAMWIDGVNRKRTTKYLTIWRDVKKNSQINRGTVGKSDGFAHHKGRRRATDVFLEDLYLVWRTLEGLPVWPDYLSSRRGYHHGCKPVTYEGQVLTLETVFEHIGDFAGYQPWEPEAEDLKVAAEDEAAE